MRLFKFTLGIYDTNDNEYMQTDYVVAHDERDASAWAAEKAQNWWGEDNATWDENEECWEGPVGASIYIYSVRPAVFLTVPVYPGDRATRISLVPQESFEQAPRHGGPCPHAGRRR